ncbi:MAG: glutamate synthase-related protein [Halobacteriota archaeon]
MNSSYDGCKPTTGTTTRVKDRSSTSGMCPLCIRECPFLCEIGLSTFRGREALYPDPEFYGESTASALKDYELTWSHFNIHSELIGAKGIEENPDAAIFPNADVSTNVGGIPLKAPILIGAYGSTEIARRYWAGIGAGSAICGLILTIGENVCGMDEESKIENGKVVYSKELKRRVEAFRDFWDGKHGEIAIQTNVEDSRLSVDEYAINDLEVNSIERKWGQGAKAIGGEVRISSLDKAILLKQRGYVVCPDPEDPVVRESFRNGVFRTFERHSRVGMPKEKDFVEDIEQLREKGAKYVSLKTGAYRPAAVAFTMKLASEANIDYITFDGAGGGTGMSPVPMMEEMGVPTVYLQATVQKCAEILKNKGKHVPDVVMAGGFTNETQIYKSIAMSNCGDGPHVKGVLLGRSPLTAVMKSSYFIELAEKDKLPKNFAKRYGHDPQKFFITAPDLKTHYGSKYEDLPLEAVGFHCYVDRIKVGLQQLMAGSRKWKLDLLDRNSLVALSERASKATGIPLPEETDIDQLERILID